MPEEHTLSLGMWEGGLPAGGEGRGGGHGRHAGEEERGGETIEDKSSIVRAVRETQTLHNQGSKGEWKTRHVGIQSL